MSGQIILLNGASSSGKTTLARALQAALGPPHSLVQLDAFEDMISDRLRSAQGLETVGYTARSTRT